jgi:hypothetical protein
MSQVSANPEPKSQSKMDERVVFSLHRPIRGWSGFFAVLVLIDGQRVAWIQAAPWHLADAVNAAASLATLVTCCIPGGVGSMNVDLVSRIRSSSAKVLDAIMENRGVDGFMAVA